MLSNTSFKQFAAEFHTAEMNVMREYVQNLLLSYLYQHPQSDDLAFKGGTALRLLFGSPRFSEDLDFSSNLTAYRIKKMLEGTLEKINKESLPWSLEESKTTSGGFFARYVFQLYRQDVAVEFNISLRDRVKPEPTLVTSPLIPAYQCMVLTIRKLVWEKIDALFRRKKPRDFFDLYFLLRNRLGTEEIIPYKKKLLKEVEVLETRSIRKELKLLLPTTHQGILRDFPTLLLTELKRL